MAEYIERKMLKSEMTEAMCGTGYQQWAIDVIDRLPTADVVEVIHGKWEAGHYEGGIFDGTNFEKCSVCQFERIFEDIRFKTTFNYCPNCGAKMDLKEGAEE